MVIICTVFINYLKPLIVSWTIIISVDMYYDYCYESNEGKFKKWNLYWLYGLCIMMTTILACIMSIEKP